MKSLFILFSMVLSSSVFGARLPTYEEMLSINTALQNSSSIRNIIDSIKQNKYDPFFNYVGNGVNVSNPGKSQIAATLIVERFRLGATLGSELENLELLDLLISKGLDLNSYQSDNHNFRKNTLLDLATRNCAGSAIDLMITRGANPALEDFYWLNAINKSLEFEQNSVNELKCFRLATNLIDYVDTLSLKTAYLFLSGGFKETWNPFINGALIDIGYPIEIKNKLRKFGVNPSTKPNVAVPDQKWIDDFVERFDQPNFSTEQHGRNLWTNWWPQYSESEKAWACYISSFDEMYYVLKKIGYSDDQIMNERFTSTSLGAPFGVAAVKAFVPYCDSIRD